MSAEKGDQWRIQDFSEGGAYGQTRFEKQGGGGGGLYASAHSLLPFAAKIRYRSIILAPMAEGGAQAPRVPSLDTPLASGISRISARGFLMVRPDTKSEGGGGGVL